MTDSAHEQFMGLVNKENLADNVSEVKLDTVAARIYQIQNQLLVTDMGVIKALIAQDPRPAYRRDDTKKVFVMRYKSVDVSFRLTESDELQITDVVAVSV